MKPLIIIELRKKPKQKYSLPHTIFSLAAVHNTLVCVLF